MKFNLGTSVGWNGEIDEQRKNNTFGIFKWSFNWWSVNVIEKHTFKFVHALICFQISLDGTSLKVKKSWSGCCELLSPYLSEKKSESWGLRRDLSDR
jgi:hypothetical protein